MDRCQPSVYAAPGVGDEQARPHLQAQSVGPGPDGKGAAPRRQCASVAQSRFAEEPAPDLAAEECSSLHRCRYPPPPHRISTDRCLHHTREDLQGHLLQGFKIKSAK